MEIIFSAYLLTMLFYLSSSAQNLTHLDQKLLHDLAQSCPADAQLKAAQNALAQVDGNKISQNWQKITSVDPYFSLRLKDQKITDQKGTGRCWTTGSINSCRSSSFTRNIFLTPYLPSLTAKRRSCRHGIPC